MWDIILGYQCGFSVLIKDPKVGKEDNKVSEHHGMENTSPALLTFKLEKVGCVPRT